MKIIKKLAFLVFFIQILFSNSVFASNNVNRIEIDVMIRDNGSANIVQTWYGNFEEGTENYIPIDTANGNITVENLSVSDENGEYSYVENWNIDASFKEKAKKFGIVKTDKGIEICFGITEYKTKKYTVSYDVGGFIKSYDDFDGTNFMFINPDMSTFPTNGYVNIFLEKDIELNEENCAVWAFGYDGFVEFLRGSVIAETESALTGDDSVIVMLRLNKGIISPEVIADGSFEDVKNKAFEGSDYGIGYEDEETEEATVFETIIGFLVLLLIFLPFVFLIKRRREIKKFYTSAEYFRDVPNGGKIEISHYLAQNFSVAKEESLIIGTLILSMINKGFIEPMVEKEIGLFGKEKEKVNLKSVKTPENTVERDLYNLIFTAAGEDGILQERELEKYAYKHPDEINNFINSVKKNGENEFVSAGGFSGGAGNRIKDLSDRGKQELSEIMGLKKFLEDFTLIAEREITETVIWKEYIVYATLFGISEKVLSQLKNVYPEKIPEIETYTRNVIIANSYRKSMYNSSQRAIQERRTSGGGGFASHSGGGGFSSGGHGGGSR